MGCRWRASRFPWPTPSPSSNTKDSSTAATKPTRATSPTCYAWVSCPREQYGHSVKRLSAELVDQMGLPEDVAFALKTNVAVIATLNVQVALLEKRLQEKIGKQSVYQLLTSVPGIGQALVTTILLETGPIERFASVGNDASYARCVDSVPTSNGKKKGEGNIKNGNKYLCRAFVEAAHFARRYCEEA